MEAFDNFWAAWGLSWKRGDYHRTTFEFNSSCELPGGISKEKFPEPYSMKVLHAANARPEEKVLIPEKEATAQSHVFTPEYVDRAQAAVVGVKIGDRRLFYLEDVNGDKGSDKVIWHCVAYSRV